MNTLPSSYSPFLMSSSPQQRRTSSACPEGFEVSRRRSCYMLVADRVSWDEAREGCRQEGADLIAVENESEQHFILQQLGMGKGGDATLFVNDKKVAEGKIPHTQAIFFSADETADVGIDLATPVVESIGSEKKSKFTGHIPKVTVEVK